MDGQPVAAAPAYLKSHSQGEYVFDHGWAEAYERAGGFRDLPICDDLDFVLRIRRVGRFIVLPEKTLTSPRRFLQVGVVRQMLRNWAVMFGFFAGVDPHRLARWYGMR